MDLGSTERAVRGVAWASAANWGGQLLSFGVFTGLAKLLSPHAFGMVALASVYIAFIQIFVTQGFGMAIVQRRNLEKEHLDSAFWIAVVTALCFCSASILLAALIARLFKEPEIAPIIRWLSISVLFYALGSVPTAILTRRLNFRALAVRMLVATGAGGAAGLGMAFFGLGVWSLVGQQLVGAVLACICLWSAVPWRPRLVISMRHLHDLYGFSLSLTGNDILWFFSQRSDQAMVGYGFGASGLGPYSLASKLPDVLYNSVVLPFQTVAFPAFSKLQSEPAEFERALHKFCEMSTFLCLPLFAGLAVVAPELVPLLFGPKWLAAVTILQMLSFYGGLRVVLSFTHPLMLAKGRAGLYLLMQIALTTFTVTGCMVAVRWSPEAVALSITASMLAIYVVVVGLAQTFLEVRALPLMRSFVFPIACSLFMMLAVGGVRAFLTARIAQAATLAICVLTGAVVYIGIAVLLRRDLVRAICEMAGRSLIPSRFRVGAAAPRIEHELENTVAGSFEA